MSNIQVSAKQIAPDKMAVTQIYKTDNIQAGDKIRFEYCGKTMFGTVEHMRYSSTFGYWMYYIQEDYAGEIHEGTDNVYKVKSFTIDIDRWILGQMITAGVVSLREAMKDPVAQKLTLGDVK